MIICDTHCDTLFTMAMHPERPRDVTKDTLARGGVSVQTMAMFTGVSPKTEDIRYCFEKMYAVWDSLLAAGWKQASDPSDAAEGETRLMLSVEGCDLMGQDGEALERWHKMGVRMAALTWNHPNALGTPHCVNATDGLTAFGKESIRRMQSLGIAVDVSHLNERGFWDVLEAGIVPLASHSCCRALCSHTRNLTDEQLRALFEAGGYVGVNFYPAFLKDDGEAGLADVADHLERMLDLGGEGRVGFGSDFDGISKKPAGLEGPQDLPALMAVLENRFGKETARDIAGINLQRYYRALAV